MMLNEMLNIKYPIFQGAMANIATAEFAAAVSNAGALGILGTGAMKAEEVRESIHRLRSLTDKPFGVNVMLMNPDTDAIMQVIAEEKVSGSVRPRLDDRRFAELSACCGQTGGGLV